MKSSTIDKKLSDEDIAEAFIFRNELSESQNKEAIDELSDARKKIKAELSDNQKLYAKVIQLRFQMEDYAKSSEYNKDLSFASFLRKYIKLNYKVNKHFAEDIQLAETELSSILNKGRLPSKKTIVRLELHSSNAIPASSWYQLLEKEKLYELQTNKDLRQKEEKYVKNRLIF